MLTKEIWERRDLLRSLLAAPFAFMRSDKTATGATKFRVGKPMKLKPFTMEARVDVIRGTGWEGIPQVAEVLLDVKDKDDLVLTNIEETYYFTR